MLGRADGNGIASAIAPHRCLLVVVIILRPCFRGCQCCQWPVSNARTDRSRCRRAAVALGSVHLLRRGHLSVRSSSEPSRTHILYSPPAPLHHQNGRVVCQRVHLSHRVAVRSMPDTTMEQHARRAHSIEQPHAYGAGTRAECEHDEEQWERLHGNV